MRAAVEAHGMEVVGLASPLLKCVLPGFAAARQPGPARRVRLAAHLRGSAAADEAGVRDRRSGWARRSSGCSPTGGPPSRSAATTGSPTRCSRSRTRRRARGVIIGLENEHACNVGTGEEARACSSTIDHPALKLVWDPANASILGETPFPDGYHQPQANRIGHVHAKDCFVKDHKPEWGPVGEMGIDWRGQIDALRRDGYDGWISLETHWTGPNGDKFEASTIWGGGQREPTAGGGRRGRSGRNAGGPVSAPRRVDERWSSPALVPKGRSPDLSRYAGERPGEAFERDRAEPLPRMLKNLKRLSACDKAHGEPAALVDEATPQKGGKGRPAP